MVLSVSIQKIQKQKQKKTDAFVELFSVDINYDYACIHKDWIEKKKPLNVGENAMGRILYREDDYTLYSGV